MPYDEFRDETDGDPNTVYEDTRGIHDRTGFYVNDDDKLRTEAKPQQPPQKQSQPPTSDVQIELGKN